MRIAFLGNFNVDYSSESHHKKSLESLGHEVIALQEGATATEQIYDYAKDSDMFIWVHTHGWVTPSSHHGSFNMVKVLELLKKANIPTLTYHLDLWFGLNRQNDLGKDPFYKYIQHFFTVDKKMADWFNANTQVKGHYIHAGVFDEEAIMMQPDNRLVAHNNDVIFVGSRGYHHEWQYRPQLIDWLKTTYKDQFTHVGGDGTGTVRGLGLNHVYANSKVVVGDSLCLNFDYPDYWSDRVYETLGRGGFLIHPYVKGMEQEFQDGKHLVFYEFGNFDQLKASIDYYLETPHERERIRQAGHELVKNNYTYKHRWQQILEEITNV
jgi:hypothetical protein